MWESPLPPESVPTATSESLLPKTSAPGPSCLELIKPSGNTVCGYIVSRIDGNLVAGRPIFLAAAMWSADESVVLAALERETAPQGITDENGMFYVADVPPDMYFLMIDEFPQPLMLKEPGNPNNDLYVDWRTTGGVVDLGVIFADVLSFQSP
jgi:hypothetical protein